MIAKENNGKYIIYQEVQADTPDNKKVTILQEDGEHTLESLYAAKQRIQDRIDAIENI